MLPNQVTYRTYRIQALDICTNENERKGKGEGKLGRQRNMAWAETVDVVWETF